MESLGEPKPFVLNCTLVIGLVEDIAEDFSPGRIANLDHNRFDGHLTLAIAEIDTCWVEVIAEVP